MYLAHRGGEVLVEVYEVQEVHDYEAREEPEVLVLTNAEKNKDDDAEFM